MKIINTKNISTLTFNERKKKKKKHQALTRDKAENVFFFNLQKLKMKQEKNNKN